MAMPLEDKQALVCGSSQGIGRACANALARLGASVTVVSRDETALRQVVAEMSTGPHQRHHLITADFVDPPSLQAKIKSHLDMVGPFQILVNNTGGPAAGPLLDASTEQLTEGFSKHVLAFQLLVQAVVPGMKEAGYGRIVNIISTSVVMPIPGLGVSNTTRGAVANWGRTLAVELAPFGITVNNILPGYTGTARLTSLLQRKADQSGVSLEEFERASKRGIPMGRFASPDEIGSVVGFLASPEASYVTGVNLPVDGGRTATQ